MDMGYHPESKPMRITIHHLAQFRRATGVSAETLDVAAGARLDDVIAQMQERHRDAFLAVSGLLFFVNNEHAEADHLLHEGDEITILAPMAGG